MTHDPEELVTSTQTRDKRPHWFAYPVGAECISYGLDHPAL
jgi:hypothetical protein